MVAQKIELSYTPRELSEVYRNIKLCITGMEHREMYDAFRVVSYINASAFKGYGYLTSDQRSYNKWVYGFKNAVLPTMFMEWCKRGFDIQRNGEAIYIHNEDGMQLSYHMVSKVGKFDTLFDAIEDTGCKWCGVRNSFMYDTIEEYNKAKLI